MQKWSRLLILFFIFPAMSLAAVPKGNGAWVYDSLYDSRGNKIGEEPGLFANEINNYNALATTGHKLTQVFPYGGEAAMYCQGSGGSSSSTRCNATNLKVGYNIESAQAYYTRVHGSANPAELMPIVDGVVGGMYLKTFNTLDQESAALFADVVAKKYCADSNIIGVQFDIEKFDIQQPGQAHFYTQIAKNFAGQHSPGSPDPYHCVDAAHPNGRIFSVFAPSGKVNAKLGEILNKYGNGFIVGPLYSLGVTTGQANSPSKYAELVESEVKRMKNRCATYNIKYQFGIPVAASIQEFEKYAGTSSGYAQLDYVKKAMKIINLHARNEPNFLGINWWAFRSRAFSRNKPLLPSKPSSSTQSYLSTRLER